MFFFFFLCKIWSAVESCSLDWKQLKLPKPYKKKSDGDTGAYTYVGLRMSKKKNSKKRPKIKKEVKLNFKKFLSPCLGNFKLLVKIKFLEKLQEVFEVHAFVYVV